MTHSIEHGLEFFERDVRRVKDFCKFFYIFIGEDFKGFEFGLLVV